MKNRIIVFGGKEFENIQYKNGDYICLESKELKLLNKNSVIENYSYEYLTALKAYTLLDSIVGDNKFKYSACVISLGEVEEKTNDLTSFKIYFRKIIEKLLFNKIKPIIKNYANSNDQNNFFSKFEDEVKACITEYDLDIYNDTEVSCKDRELSPDLRAVTIC